MRGIGVCLLLAMGCGVSEVSSGEGEADLQGSTGQAVTCAARMWRFPVNGPHNIGYDAASCGSGTCATTCPDAHANSDWNGSAGHHGIDVFAHRGAELVAVADGTIVRVGVASSTSGLRVRLRDACGWEYYYGHLESAAVSQGQHVSAGQVIGYMGNSGTSGVHLHFNVSADGAYSNDINPFNLLSSTSATACPAPPPPPPAAEWGPLYRYYSPTLGDHFYTAVQIPDGAFGFGYEGTEGQIANGELPGTVPLYRFWNGSHHFYTVSEDERAAVLGGGWGDEGIEGWVLPPGAGTQTALRYYNGFNADHFFTVTAMEDGAFGYGLEGPVWSSP